MKEKIVEALKMVYDPELPLNIYELGLIYAVDWDEATRRARITMTLTSPNCPAAESLPKEVEAAVSCVDGVERVAVKLTFTPPYDMDRLPESAKLALGIL